MAKVFAVRSSIDCPDRRNKAHSVCRGHLATTPDLRQGQCCLKINQPGIRTGNSFSLQVVCFCPVQSVSEQGRRVLTDGGYQGMDGKAGVGSTTEKKLGAVAAAIYAHCPELDNKQLNEIIEWVRFYRD